MPVNITEDFVRQLMDHIDFLTTQNKALTDTITELNQTIKELKKQLNKNSKKQFQTTFFRWVKETACKQGQKPSWKIG